MAYEDEFSIIFKSALEFTAKGYDKWFANVDEIDDLKSNLRILGISQSDDIIVYDDILLRDDCNKILKLLFESDIHFIYITGLIELK